MAKAAKTKASAKSADNATEPKGGALSGKKLLLASILLSLVSLGGGIAFAMLALRQDAEAYAPEYVEEEPEDHGGEESATASGVVDPLAADGHPASEAIALKDEEGHGEEVTGTEGILEFDEILTNINGFNAQGAPTSAFLKINLVLIYRSEPGAAELMNARKPFMRDLFNGYVRGLTEGDLRGMAGLLNIKSELLKRARVAAGSDLPQEILINNLIVQ